MKYKNYNTATILENFDKKLNKNYKVFNNEEIKKMDEEYEHKIKKKEQLKLQKKQIKKQEHKNEKKKKNKNLNKKHNQNNTNNRDNSFHNRDNNINQNGNYTNNRDYNIINNNHDNINFIHGNKNKNHDNSFPNNDDDGKNQQKDRREILPHAFLKKDIIGLSETGSGKTACFIIPILQDLKVNKQSFYALVISPTRELCIQISQNFQALGMNLLINICTIYGGVDIVTQSLNLAKKPNVIVSTPGRILDHLNNTKGFNLKNLKYLVFDEADKLLSQDFESSINKLLLILPPNRITFLFSATMTKNVAKLKKACLKNPVKVEVSNKYSTVSTLIETYIFLPLKYKYTYLSSLCFHYQTRNIIIFTNTCATAQN
ncbi:RNA helicase [Plasmodium falciparum IGH-CR14]|uniref:RNA helicase n=1 Tax=Plasmodium falciparum IGH-CR14 TaxID=580059 RepID=A0A0L1IAS3_PLAFA|nr:RNA helicase [Plasmodium falciparum IGH-CR14]